jgi:hypothetical protein
MPLVTSAFFADGTGEVVIEKGRPAAGDGSKKVRWSWRREIGNHAKNVTAILVLTQKGTKQSCF